MSRRGTRDELAKLTETELARAYVECVRAARATDHVGRASRMARQCWKIVQELVARGRARQVLQQLADHPDEAVRRWAEGALARLDTPAPAGVFVS